MRRMLKPECKAILSPVAGMLRLDTAYGGVSLSFRDVRKIVRYLEYLWGTSLDSGCDRPSRLVIRCEADSTAKSKSLDPDAVEPPAAFEVVAERFRE